MANQDKGTYSDSIQFSGKKRYYVMNAQRNKPLLDAEIREMSNVMLDLNRWLARGAYGDVAVLSPDFTDAHTAGDVSKRANAFQVTEATSSNLRNFKVVGGENQNGDNDTPAMMYLKGWYVCLSNDIEFTDQDDSVSSHITDVIKEYPTETLPDPSSDQARSYANRSDTYTKTSPASISSGIVGQVDVVYVELNLVEVTDDATDTLTDTEDPSLKDPIVGTDTANRLKAVVTFHVYENWAGIDPTNPDIFNHTFFADSDFSNNVARTVRAPIAMITRSDPASELVGEDSPSNEVVNGDFTDLLTLHGKRVTPPVEISHRLANGGFTDEDVITGAVPSLDGEEDWGATGKNEGIGTEALNSSSVTPRTLEKEGDYRIDSLAVAGGFSDATNETTTPAGMTGPEGTIQPDADGLESGEITTKKIFTDKTYFGGGETGARRTIEEARTVSDDSLVTLDGKGHEGPVLKVIDENGDLLSAINHEGRLALGKEVDSADPSKVLDVLGKSKFVGDADMTKASADTFTVKKNGHLDLYNAEALGETGASSGNILDKYNSTGTNGQYLSSAIEGVAWRNAPLHTVETIAELKAMEAANYSANIIFVKGYFTANDGGGGLFMYNSLLQPAVADNGYYVNTADGVVERLIVDGTISVLQYGAKGTDSTSIFQAAITQALAKKLTLLIPFIEGGYGLGGDDLVFPEGLPLEISNGVIFSNLFTTSTAATLHFKGPTVVNTMSPMVEDFSPLHLKFYSTALSEVYPEWWGANYYSGTGQATPLQYMYDDMSDGYRDTVYPNPNYLDVTAVLGMNPAVSDEYSCGTQLDITIPTRFVDAGHLKFGIRISIYVNAPIYAEDKLVFKQFSYSSEDTATVYWNITSDINALWFWNEEQDELINECTLARLLGGSERTAYFPSKDYVLVTPKVDFGDLTLDFKAGARLDARSYTGSTIIGVDVTISKVVDNGNFKYIGPRAPYIGNTTIKSSWFDSNIIGDTTEDTNRRTLTLSFGALTRRAKVQDGAMNYPGMLNYEQGTSYLSEPPPVITLDGEGKTYEWVPADFTSSLVIPSGNFDGSQTTSQGMVVKNLTMKSENVFVFSESSSLSNDSVLVDLTFVDCAIVGDSELNNLAEYPEMVRFENMYYVTFNRCQLSSGSVQYPEDTSSNTVRNLSLIECHMDEASLALDGVAVFKADNCKLQRNNNPSNSTTLLDVGYGAVVTKCVFVSKNLDSVPHTLLERGLGIKKPHNMVIGNRFYNMSLEIEDGDERTEGHIITDNSFEAAFGSDQPTDSSPIDTFIKIIAGVSDSTPMRSILITGNKFLCPHVSGGTPISSTIFRSSYTSAFEAIKVIEEDGFAFDDEEIIDVIVKDNVGDLNVNIRSTEVTETSIAGGADDSMVVPTSDPSTHKRLVGYPRYIQVSINLPESSNWWCIATATQPRTRHGYIVINGRYSEFTGPDTVTSIKTGFPTGLVVATTKFRMYKTTGDASEALHTINDNIEDIGD